MRATAAAVGASAVVLVLLVSGLAAPSAPHGRPATSIGSGPFHGGDVGSSSGPEALAAAEASLERGSGPAARIGALVDPECSGLRVPVIFGPSRCVAEPAGALRTGTGSGGWSLLGIPQYFYGGSLAYDAADGYVLEFGGGLGGFSATWKYLHGAWTNISSTVGVPPLRRESASLAYDPAVGAVVLFAGLGIPPTVGSPLIYENDTWEFKGGGWANVTALAGTAPVGRLGAGLAYDANDSALVLFGGTDSNGNLVAGTWEFTSNGTWRNVSANQTVSPDPVDAPAFAGDLSDGYALLFGGGNTSAPYQNQTWTFTGNRWTNVSASVHGNGSFPSSREEVTLTTDSSPGGVMMFGGLSAPPNGSFLQVPDHDTWHYRAGVWSLVLSNGTPAGPIASLASDDPPDDGMVVFGGEDPINGYVLTTTWNLSVGCLWCVAVPPTSPPLTGYPSMVYDSTTGSVVLFGGGDLNETWTYSAGVWTERHPSVAPPGRIGAAFVDDPADGAAVLFGGAALVRGVEVALNDTWLWANGTWTNVTSRSSTAPSGRALASDAYDATAGRVVVFGGDSPLGFLNDTWEFHGDLWTNVTTTGAAPSPRLSASLGSDPSAAGLALFGGYPCTGGTSSGGYCRDTWTFSSGVWKRATPTTSPPGQYGGGLTYDPAFSGEILVGGYGWVTWSVGNASVGRNQELSSTWEYAGGAWSNVTAEVGPAVAGAGNAEAYDAADGYLLQVDFGVGGGGSGIWLALRAPSAGEPLSVATPTATVNPVPANSTTELSVVVSGGATPYEVGWSGLPTGCASANATSISCTPTSATVAVVSVTVTDANGTTMTSGGLTLTVTAASQGPGPALASTTVTPSGPTVAGGGSVVLTARSLDSAGHAFSGATYAWSSVSGAFGSFNQTSGASVTFDAGSTAGTEEVKVIASAGGHTATGFANVTVSGASSTVPPQNTSSTAFPYVQVAVIGVVILAVALVAAFLAYRRSRPPNPPSS